MFFDCLYDEDVISEDAFYKWETSKDPAEQRGKGIALKSVTAFFTWLREAEEESEDNWCAEAAAAYWCVEARCQYTYKTVLSELKHTTYTYAPTRGQTHGLCSAGVSHIMDYKTLQCSVLEIRGHLNPCIIYIIFFGFNLDNFCSFCYFLKKKLKRNRFGNS